MPVVTSLPYLAWKGSIIVTQPCALIGLANKRPPSKYKRVCKQCLDWPRLQLLYTRRGLTTDKGDGVPSKHEYGPDEAQRRCVHHLHRQADEAASKPSGCGRHAAQQIIKLTNYPFKMVDSQGSIPTEVGLHSFAQRRENQLKHSCLVKA